MSLRPADFEYDLPPELIAQSPCRPRDRSRLMVLCRDSGAISHHVFADLPGLLCAGDVLVLNDTRVIPAKFVCRRSAGGRIEGLFLRECQPGRWQVLLKGAGRCRGGQMLALENAPGVELRLIERQPGGRWEVEVSPPADAQAILSQAGRTPLPPYIRRAGGSPDEPDRQSYQTIFAARPGAVAAPTAGLHFTDGVLRDLAGRGVETAMVTLHVGLGTFAPVVAGQLSSHRMHSEWYELPARAAEIVNAARSLGHRAVAVGTTSVRVMETSARSWPSGPAPGCVAAGGPAGGPGHGKCRRIDPAEGWTDLFIYPPAEFLAADALVTNFHLPRSTLLMLVAAFCSPGSTAGVEMILGAYREAIRLGYRFYSYGDAMLIL